MKKHILMLSVALAGSSSMPAFAQQDPLDDITTALTAPVATATANPDGSGTPADILLDNGGSITVTTGGPAVTINSNNSFQQLTGTTLSNKDTDSAVGILVDLTTQSIDATNGSCTTGCAHTFEGLIEAGTIDLSGSGATKRAIWFEGPTTDSGLGPFAYTGNVDLTGSQITVTGDNSVGVLVDPEAVVNGTMTFSTIKMQTTSLTATSTGVIAFDNEGVVNGDLRFGYVDDQNVNQDTANITVTGSSSTAASGLIAVKIGGTVNGDVTIDRGSSIVAIGQGAEGILITGDINACNQTASPGCTSLGSFVNKGVIQALGTNATIVNATGNPSSGSALLLGGSIAGGIFNGGPASLTDTTVAASIFSEVAGAAVQINPGLQTGAIINPVIIDVYRGDLTDPGFSFDNRGSISDAPINANQNATAITITGDGSTSPTTLTGGLFNSDAISATASSNSSATGAVSAVGVFIGPDASVGPYDTYVYGVNGCDCMVYQPGAGQTVPKNPGDQAALVVADTAASGTGSIIATVSGPTSGNSAVAIEVASNATLPSIINSGNIEAIASSTDTSITGLRATAIQDSSGTLTYILNNGSIQAIATQLVDKTQQAVAIDLSGDTTGVAAGGVEIDNRATANQSALILGDIKFGVGDHQIVNVFGNSTAHTATIDGNISFGHGGLEGTDELNIGNFASVTGTITADALLGVKVDVQNNGMLTITNDTAALSAAGFHVESGGILNLTVLEDFNTGIVDASTVPGGFVTLDAGAKLNITYGSFVPANSVFVLFKADDGLLNVSDTGLYNTQLQNSLPYLFESATLQLDDNGDGTESYDLHVVTKDASQLGLTGYAAQMLPYANQALVNDNTLGGAIVSGVVDQKSAQLAYNAFAPDVTGATRAIAMSLTDQATGPVAARQRMLRMYGKDSGDVTLWGQEFAEYIKDPGDTSTGQTGFKDHGFGFVLGLDGGEPKTGWYGGALSFYSGDIIEAYPRDSHSDSLWYTLTGYTDWRGKGLFLDTKLDVGYFTVKQKRYINLTIPNANGTTTSFVDEADSRRPGLVGSAGFTTGVILAYGATTLTPQISVDGMTMRQEGYTESHPTKSPGNGEGFDLSTDSYYSSSMRVFVGADARQDLDFGDFFVQPDVRLGYRYDLLNDPAKVRARFADVPVNGIDGAGPTFTIEGPDPSQGNFVAGGSLSATTDAWTLGANFDFVRGTNGATTEVGTIHLLGRI